MEDLSERAAKFFPKAKDWPPPERRKTITAAEMVAPKKKKNESSKTMTHGIINEQHAPS
jgi:hypothetical protein